MRLLTCLELQKVVGGAYCRECASGYCMCDLTGYQKIRDDLMIVGFVLSGIAVVSFVGACLSRVRWRTADGYTSIS